MNSIATRRGDTGQTDLLFGTRIEKSHPRIHSLGSVDELNAALGLLRVTALRGETKEIVSTVQPLLISLMGELATPPGKEDRYAETHCGGFDTSKITFLDSWVERLESAGALKFTGWALPGEAGVLTGAYADLARVACRRAERHVMDLSGTPYEIPNKDVVRFLNRLSDVLWLLARWEEKKD
jgi:cob(I)alamin adenosyltransferase